MKFYLPFIIAFTLCSTKKISGQIVAPDSMNCSIVLKQISYFRKLDSLANNGFRVYSFSNLLDCKIDEISSKFLIECLGNPDTIWRNKEALSFVYFCFRRSKMPEKFKGLFDDVYISFRFDEKGTRLISIIHGYFN